MTSSTLPPSTPERPGSRPVSWSPVLSTRSRRKSSPPAGSSELSLTLGWRTGPNTWWMQSWRPSVRASVGDSTSTSTRVQDCKIIGGLGAQKQAILAAVVESQDLALNTLRLGHGNIGLISADIMAAAAVKLNTFSVRAPTTAQLGEILTRLAATEDTS